MSTMFVSEEMLERVRAEHLLESLELRYLTCSALGDQRDLSGYRRAAEAALQSADQHLSGTRDHRFERSLSHPTVESWRIAAANRELAIASGVLCELEAETGILEGIPARSLHPGDRVRTADGRAVTITSGPVEAPDLFGDCHLIFGARPVEGEDELLDVGTEETVLRFVEMAVAA